MKLISLILTLGALALAGCNDATSPPKLAGAAPAHTANIEMFVMSQCPYGVQVEKAIGPVKDQLGAGLDVKIHFIGDGEAGSLSSMHGAPEVKGDLVQVCADKLDHEKSLKMILCQNENVRAVDTNWESCAATAGIDVAALRTCADGQQGQDLLAASFAEARNRGAKGSPTIFLDGAPYQGGRKSADFLRAICGTYGDDAPAACSDIPTPPRIDAIFLSDARCAECDLHPVEGKLRGVFNGLKVEYLDYSSESGKALYDELHAADASFRTLPAVLLSPDAKKDEGYSNVERYMRPVGNYLHLRMGGKFDPTAEICDNGSDDDGNGQIDCDDSGCQSSLLCRETLANRLDLYIMSHCPYGAKAMIAANEVVDHFGDDIDLKVHFIGDMRGGKLNSMHGQAEVDDDIREICAQEHYAANHQFLDYLDCISKDYKNADWKACARQSGMEPSVLQACFDGEGPSLLEASFKGAQALNIGSSPTFLVNNKRKFNAIAAPALQKQFCADNKALPGCASVVVAEPGNAAPVPAGQCE